jgi:hypothetical protein
VGEGKVALRRRPSCRNLVEARVRVGLLHLTVSLRLARDQGVLPFNPGHVMVRTRYSMFTYEFKHGVLSMYISATSVVQTMTFPGFMMPLGSNNCLIFFIHSRLVALFE